MSTTQEDSNGAAGTPHRHGIPMRLEVVVIGVTDVQRAKDFYTRLGWRDDGDGGADGYRIVQLTPPGSSTSVIFGSGVTAAAPGAGGDLLLAVDDLEAAREELIRHGVEVGEAFHDAGGGLAGGFYAAPDQEAPGRDPEGRSYATYARFSDPDGNTWLLQEIVERLPGRVDADVATLAELLRETAEHHDAYEKASAPHDWWDWYAAYADARQRGADIKAAEAAADQYMLETKGITADRG